MNEAKSPEEIAKIIHYKYDDKVSSKFIDDIMSIDPTTKKSFTRWACEMALKDYDSVKECYDDGKLNGIFDYFKKNSNKWSLSDIKTIKEAEEIAFTITLEDIISKNGDGPENDFEYEDIDGTWGIGHANTYEASKKLGKYCKWCTAEGYGNDPYHYNNYKDCGDLYILFNKEKDEYREGRHFTFKRSQIFLPVKNSSRNLEYNDSSNNPTSAEKEGFTETLYNFFSEKGYEIDKNSFEDEETHMIRYHEWRQENCILTFQVNGSYYSILPEYDLANDIREDCAYAIYNEDYEMEEIDNSPIEYKDYFNINDILEYNNFTILKLANGESIIVLDEYRGWCSVCKEDEYTVLSDNGFTLLNIHTQPDCIIENDEKIWNINKNYIEYNYINVPEQIDGDSFNVTIGCDNIKMLISLHDDGTVELNNYNKKGLDYKLENNDYVIDNNGENQSLLNYEGITYIIEYNISKNYSICKSVNSEKTKYGVIKNDKEQFLCEPKYESYKFLPIGIFLFYNEGLTKGDLLDLHKEEIEYENISCFLEYNGVSVIKKSETDYTFLSDTGGMFKFTKPLDKAFPFYKLKTEKNVVLFDITKFNVDEEFVNMTSIPGGVRLFERKDGMQIFTVRHNKGYNPNDGVEIGYIDVNTAKVSENNTHIIAKYNETGLYGGFSIVKRKLTIPPKYTQIETYRYRLLELFNENNFVLYNPNEEKIMFNGLRFTTDSDDNLFLNYKGIKFLVKLGLTLEAVKYQSKTGALQYVEDGDDNIKALAKEIPYAAVGVKMNEHITKNFYNFLERMDNSKYNIF